MNHHEELKITKAYVRKLQRIVGEFAQQLHPEVDESHVLIANFQYIQGYVDALSDFSKNITITNIEKKL